MGRGVVSVFTGGLVVQAINIKKGKKRVNRRIKGHLLLGPACDSRKNFCILVIPRFLMKSGAIHHDNFGEVIPDLELVDAAKVLIQSKDILARQAQSPGQKK